jgi:hypothetical protein
MGQLQKTPVGLARRILNFEDESTSSPLFTSSVVETKALVTAEYPIQTICEAAESIMQIIPTTETVPQPAPSTTTTIKKPASKTIPEARPSKSTEQSSTTARVTNVKPKSSPVWKVGKASKNAVNSEVQSLSLANKVQPQSTTPRVQSQSLSHKGPVVPCPATKSQPTQAQSWAHACSRVQTTPSLQQQSRAKLNKSEPPKVVARHAVTRQQTHTPAAATTTDVDEGWETVRGRTRSRTSPAKATPVLTRASTMVYGSRLEAKQSTKVTNRQPTVRSGLVKPSIAQSLPSLCDRVPPKPEPPKEPLPVCLPVVPKEPTPVIAVVNSVAHDSVAYDDSVIVSSDEDKDEAQEAAEVAEEEAEMARREEALTIEEENLQREIRETERSDNEGDETWDEPINVTPVCLVI